MIVETTYVDIPTDANAMRTFVAAPHAEGPFPAIWCYSDIFQLTGPMLRSCVHLAGYGFVAAAPEIYHRIEPRGSVIPFDDSGRTRGLEDAAKTSVADFAAVSESYADLFLSCDRSSLLNWMRNSALSIAGSGTLRQLVYPASTRRISAVLP